MQPVARILVAAVAINLIKPLPAGAHPHVFAEAKLAVTLSPDRTLTSLRHFWRFDDLFSSTVLMQFDQDIDLVLDDAELQEAADTVRASLAEYSYFQLVQAQGKDVAMAPPARFEASFDNNQFVVSFETAPAKPLSLGSLVAVGVYDPTFYTAIDFVGDDSVKVIGLPEGCGRTIVRPDGDTAIAMNQTRLTDAFFSDPTGTDLSKIFATRLELTCPAE